VAETPTEVFSRIVRVVGVGVWAKVPW